MTDIDGLLRDYDGVARQATPLRSPSDGTQPWPDAATTPLDRVAQAMASVMRARTHVDMAVRELADAIMRLMEAAGGGHH
jgi:hypothetical protein